jgi:hypothetical protein
MKTKINSLRSAEQYRKEQMDQDKNRFGFVPKLDSWNALTEEVTNLPPEVGLALMSNRPELILGMDEKRCLEVGKSPEAIQGMLNLIRVLLETNRALQEHCETIAERSKHALSGLQSSINVLKNVEDLANFKEPTDDDCE